MPHQLRPYIIATGLLLVGCGTPNAENIRLRKINQDLQTQVTTLKQKTDADQRTIDGLMKRSPTIAMLPQDQLHKLWVTSGITLGRLSGGVDLDPTKPGDEALRVYVSPHDDNGVAIQAAGSSVVEAFDLAQKGDNRIGRWTFDTQTSKSLWRSFLLESGYALTCPWEHVPHHADITVRVTFTDELTHIPFVAEKLVRITLPVSATAPTTSPAAR